MPINVGERRLRAEKFNLQSFERRLDIRELKERCLIWDTLIVEHHANAPDDRREADILGAGQVVKDNFGFGKGSHIELRNWTKACSRRYGA